jgi:hypothetical protein
VSTVCRVCGRSLEGNDYIVSECRGTSNVGFEEVQQAVECLCTIHMRWVLQDYECTKPVKGRWSFPRASNTSRQVDTDRIQSGALCKWLIDEIRRHANLTAQNTPIRYCEVIDKHSGAACRAESLNMIGGHAICDRHVKLFKRCPECTRLEVHWTARDREHDVTKECKIGGVRSIRKLFPIRRHVVMPYKAVNGSPLSTKVVHKEQS